MLYDPKWEQETKADPFTLENLVAWLETQDPTTEYEVLEPSICLMGQFASSQGSHDPEFVSMRLTDDLVGPFCRIAFGRLCGGPYTFGAALERARAELAKQRTR